MKKFQKGNNDGYALLYVLIVILVLCAIAMAICTVALRNFQLQERSVAQIQRLYQAEGEIEKFVALAEDVRTPVSASSGICETQLSAQAEAEELCKLQYKAKLEGRDKDKLDDEKGNVSLSVDTSSTVDLCKFTLIYKNKAVEIETTVSLLLSYQNSFEKHEYDYNNDGTTDEIKWSCKSTINPSTNPW